MHRTTKWWVVAAASLAVAGCSEDAPEGGVTAADTTQTADTQGAPDSAAGADTAPSDAGAAGDAGVTDTGSAAETASPDTSTAADTATASDTAAGGDAASDAASDTSGPVNRAVDLPNPWGVVSKGTFAAAAGSAGGPGVVLLHQFQSDRTKWQPYLADLTSRGWRVLAVDLPAHGESGAPSGKTAFDVLSDPGLAPVAVGEAIGWLISAAPGAGGANPARVAVIGASVGANLAYVANLDARVKRSVVVSARDTAVTNLMGVAGPYAFEGVFCVAGRLDSSGDQAGTCEGFDATTTAPKKVTILEDSADHGEALLANHADIWTDILTWLDAEL